MITEADVRAVIAKAVPRFDVNSLSAQTPFSETSIDSLDHFNILIQLEDNHGLVVAAADIPQLSSIQQIVDFSNR
jgi:acyl carrier protein